MTKQEAAARLIAAQTAANVPVITANKVLKTKIEDLLRMAAEVEATLAPVVTAIIPHVVVDAPKTYADVADRDHNAALALDAYKAKQPQQDHYGDPQTDNADDEDEEADAEAVRAYLKDQFSRLFAQHGGNEKRGVCKALRAVARAWDDTRKEFLQAAEDNGLNKANAAAEWHSGRNRGKV